jgi:hypothetical protein
LTLDSFSVSEKGAARVKDCKVWHKGVESDHSTILMSFSLTDVKFKVENSLQQGEIDWHAIKHNQVLNKQFNTIPFENFTILKAAPHTAILVSPSSRQVEAQLSS